MLPSPCVKVCHIDPRSTLCQGCGRTLKEIQDWLHMPDADKQHTLDLITERRAGVKPMTPKD